MSRAGRDFASTVGRGSPDAPVVWRGSVWRLFLWSPLLVLGPPAALLAAGGVLGSAGVGGVLAVLWLVLLAGCCRRCAAVDYGATVEVRNAFSTSTLDRPVRTGYARWTWGVRGLQAVTVTGPQGRRRCVWALLAMDADRAADACRMLERPR